MLVISAKEKNIDWDMENLECNVGGKAEHSITESWVRLTSEKVRLGGGEEVCQTAIYLKEPAARQMANHSKACKARMENRKEAPVTRMAWARGSPGGDETGLRKDKQGGHCEPLDFPCEVDGAEVMAPFYRWINSTSEDLSGNPRH